MTEFEHITADTVAERATRVISHLDGALDPTMLDAMQGVWSTLERASVDNEAHARAVRARLFWQSLSPSNGMTAPVASFMGEDEAAVGIVPSWMLPDEEDGDHLPDLADAA